MNSELVKEVLQALKDSQPYILSHPHHEAALKRYSLNEDLYKKLKQLDESL
jgi:hypothetical protein